MLSEFIDMGGYGNFVWSAYGIWLIVMLLNYIEAIIKEKKVIKTLIKRHKKNTQ